MSSDDLFQHAPVNIVVPLHLSHYDIIRSILSNSHVEKEIYIHDDADLISTSWAIKEFNRCYTSQKENKRLIQAGIPKVRGIPKVPVAQLYRGHHIRP